MLFSAVGPFVLVCDSLHLLLFLENPLNNHNNIKHHRQVGIYVYYPYGRPFICLYNVYVCNSVSLYYYNIYFVSLQCIYLNCTLTTMSASIRADSTNKYYL